jgi:hypothetical protein
MRRRVPWRGARKYEDFRQKQVERFTNYQRCAQDHTVGRNAATVQVLCYLSILRNAGAIPPHTIIGAKGAMYQSTSGALAQNQEAAHCLPCQILVAGYEPASLRIGNRPLGPLTQHAMRSLFAQVTVLPRCFNTADKAAERVHNGLADAFMHACQDVVNCPRQSDVPQPRTYRQAGERYGELYTLHIWPINRERVRHAYASVWVPGAESAYQRAGDEIERSGTFLSAQDDPDEVLWILSTYLEYHRLPPSKLLEFQMSQLEREFSS